MLAVILRSHPDAYDSPKNLAIEAGVLVLILVVLWLISPRTLVRLSRKRPRDLRRLDREAQRLVEDEKRKKRS